MAKSSKAVVPENVLRDVFITGLREIKRAGIEVRVGTVSYTHLTLPTIYSV